MGFDRGRWLSAVAAAIGVAALLAATGGEYASAEAQVVGAVLATGGLMLLGRAVGWRSIPITTVCVVIVGYVGSALFFERQPEISGMDQIGRDPASVILALPFIWIILALAAATRRLGRVAFLLALAFAMAALAYAVLA